MKDVPSSKTVVLRRSWVKATIKKAQKYFFIVIGRAMSANNAPSLASLLDRLQEIAAREAAIGDEAGLWIAHGVHFWLRARGQGLHLETALGFEPFLGVALQAAPNTIGFIKMARLLLPPEDQTSCRASSEAIARAFSRYESAGWTRNRKPGGTIPAEDTLPGVAHRFLLAYGRTPSAETIRKWLATSIG